jgi:PAS domain S-box-containing protein
MRAEPAGQPWGASLRPPALEREYREIFLRKDGRAVAFVVGALSLLWLLFLGNDFRFIADPSKLVLAVGVKVALAVLGVVVVLVALRTRRPAVLDAWVLAWFIGYALTEVATQSTRPRTYFLPAMALLVVIMIAWVAIQSHFVMQAFSAALLTGALLIWLIAFRDRPSTTEGTLIVLGLIATTVLGASVSWRSGRQRRSMFLERRRLAVAEEQARQAGGRLRDVLEASTDGFWERDLVTGRVFQSARMRQIEGLPAVDAVVDGDAWRKLVHPDDWGGVAPLYAAVIAGEEERFDVTLRIRHADGSWKWVRSMGKVVARDDGGTPVRLAGTIVDVHAQVVAEKELRRSEAFRRAILENFPNGLVGLFDHDLRFVLIDGTNTVTEIHPRNWKGRTVLEITPPGHLKEVEAAYRATLAGESRQLQLEWNGRVIDTVLRPIRDPDGTVVLGLMMSQDVTERRALEVQLQVNSRLAAMGTLVAGVAHEINNPLAGALASHGLATDDIRDLLGALQRGEPLDRGEVTRYLERVLEELDDAQAGDKRVARIVKDLTTFGRPDARRVPVRLMDVLDEAMRWLPASMSREAKVIVENEGAPDVVASAGQLGQVLVNLVTNASKSIPEGRRGVVTIRLGSGSPGMARLEVVDNGSGMAPDVLTRVFDPFFTTRDVGQGMGLGLPVCHAIVTAHGGTITATSTPGEGSTFRVELPVAPYA